MQVIIQNESREALALVDVPVGSVPQVMHCTDPKLDAVIKTSLTDGVFATFDAYSLEARQSRIFGVKIDHRDPRFEEFFIRSIESAGFTVIGKDPSLDMGISAIIEKLPEESRELSDLIALLPSMSRLEKSYFLRAVRDTSER